MRALKLMVCATLFAAVPAFAGNCRWEAAPTAINFGNYSVFGTTNSAATSSFTVRCTPNTTGVVTLSRGGSGSYAQRQMANGANRANYNLFTQANGGAIWGDGTGGSTTYLLINGTPQDKVFTEFIYGIAPFGQNLAVGTYTDTVVATLSWDNGAGSRPPISITISMTVIEECRVDAFTLGFGNYSPFSGAALNQSTQLRVYCTIGTFVSSVVLNNGSFPLGPQRRMMEPGGVFLNYDVSMPVTSGTSTSTLLPVAGGFTINGTVAAGQDAAVANYTDTLVATVNY